MPDSDPLLSAERAESTGSWRPALGQVPRPSDSAPTVITGGGSSRKGGSSDGGRRNAANLPMPGPGDRLESFELREAIGVGGMGAVFLADDTRLHRQVALKILPPEHSFDAETVQRFYQEGRAAARLDHENIARIYTIGTDKGYHFIAFEYIEGTTIRQRVQQHGPLSVAETINYTLQIANALVHACERGVVHRDIKPSNIVITPHGRAKLVDMGLARRFERGVSDDGLTQSGMTLGTFDYISPEQARDPRDVDVRSDLYSLGCTMFHMLSGRPPFPEGTVLQKLLQHQEEPAPDVRTVNPSVPGDLASIILKLMEKDRDRRYQTPEQLARDLLSLAGSLGLRSISPEGLVWMTNTPAPSWERHLVWGLPAICLGLIVAALFWWGQRPEPTLRIAPVEAPLAGPSTASVPEVPRVKVSELPRTSMASERLDGPNAAESERPEVSLAATREIPVGSDEDLAAVLDRATSGTTLLLTDDGPYTLRPTSVATGASGRDLTVRAAAGVRPVLRMARGASGLAADSALLAFHGGRVRLEGLEFRLDPSTDDEPTAALFVEDADLLISGCRFRRPDPTLGHGSATAIRLRVAGAPADPGEVAPSARIVGTHFDGGQIGVLAVGPADVVLRDCTFGPTEPVVWLDNDEADPPVVAHLGLRSVTILAGETPVFRFDGTAAHVAVDDSVVAPIGSGRATLVATDEPDRLDWFGRENLYGRIGVYLQPTDNSGRPPISRFASWQGDDRTIREARSEATASRVWALEDPTPALARSDPSDAFRLADLTTAEAAPDPTLGPSPDVEAPPRNGVLARIFGSALARRPFGVLPERDERALEPTGGLRTTPDRDDSSESSAATTSPVEIARAEPPRDRTGTDSGRIDVDDPVESDTLDPMTPPDASPMAPPTSDPMAVAPVGPMDVAPIEEEPVTETPVPSSSYVGPDRERPIDVATGNAGSTAVDPPGNGNVRVESGFPFFLGRDEDETAPIRTAEELRRAIRRLETRGGTLRLAADAEMDLVGLEIPRGGRWVFEAEPGPTRPKFRFRATEDAVGPVPDLLALVHVAPGAALELRGVDVILDEVDAPPRGRWAAFAVGSGTDLALDRCTVTIEGQEPAGQPVRSAMVAVLAEAGPGGANDVAAATVRAGESLLRGGGDLADIAAGRRLDLSLTHCIAAFGGSITHGHGLPRTRVPEPLKLTLRQSTARASGGLVRLHSAPGEPELPLAEVVARDSVLATDESGAPLFRVEGQDILENLYDRIRWEGHGVVYHRIDTYRHDQTALSGMSPVGFKRSAWERAVGPLEDDAYHGDADFLNPWDEDRPIWTATAEDMRLAPETPTPTAGPDISRIPEAPLTDDF